MAKTWFLTAANVNDAKAQSNLGQMYLGGIGVDQSRAEATFWLKLAARQGDPAAARLLDGLLPTIPSDELRSIDERIVKWQKGGFSGPKSSAP
jgi:TPR repeat protein